MNVHYFKELWKSSLMILMLCFGMSSVWGQVSVSNLPQTETQNFNSLTSGTWTNNTTLPGWYVRTTNTSSITSYGANTGSTTTAGLYAYGINGTNPLSDRALGFATSNGFTGSAGSGKNLIGWRFKNNSGQIITSVTIVWSGEQWRKENTNVQSLILSYQISNSSITDINSGDWVVTDSQFDSKINTSGAAALDGNNSQNREDNITKILEVTIGVGEEIVLRWEDLNDSGNDHHLAIDDVSVTFNTNAAPTYSITYSGNDSDGGSAPVDTNEYEESEEVTVLANTFIKTGYTFTSWNTEADGNGISYVAEDTFNMPANDVTLYAQWALNTYTVTYDGNGADSGSVPVDQNSPYNHGSTVTLLGLGDLDRDGYNFMGWTTEVDNIETVIVDSFTITSDVTLYAFWADASLEEQTITFEPLENKIYGDDDFALTATSTSGLTITYTSSNENVATVNGNMVTIVGVGTTDITAIQVGGDGYLPANPVVQTLTIDPKNLTISGITVEDKTYDGTTTATIDISVAQLDGVVGDDDVDFATGTGEFASADAGNDVAVNLISNFTLTGTAAANYTLTQPTLTGNILKADQTISGFENLSKSNTDVPFDLPELTNEGQTVSYASSNTAVATISGNTVTIVGAGTTTITATADANQNYNAIVAEDLVQITLTVTVQYAGVGVFEKITTLNDLTDGYYVVARGTRGMSNTLDSSNLLSQDITITDNTITNPSTNMVWKIETNGSGKVLYNEVVEQYVSSTSNSSNNISLSSTITDTERFTATIVSTYFRFTNVGHTSRVLQKNTGASGPFRWYGTSSNQHDLELYKLSTDPALTLSETIITGLNYVAGNGPSASQDFQVSGINLDGSAIVVTAPANFEVSLDGETYNSTVNLSSTDGTLAETTVYVRLAVGLTADDYSGNITISGGSATEVTLAVSGEVTPVCDEGTLTAGTAEASVTEVTSGGSVNLSLTGTSTGAGLSYQWQSSSNGTDWSDIDEATSATYAATNITTATYFRAEVTCGATTVVSNSVQITIAYCLPNPLPSSEYEHITNVTVGTDINNTTGGSNYAFYPTPVANLSIGEPTEVSITIANGYLSDNVFLFIDWNQDKDFSDANEVITLNYTAASGTFEVTGTIIPPADAVLGNTRMRIKLMDGNNSNPCATYSWGEIEDYTVNILPAAIVWTTDNEWSNVTGPTITDDVIIEGDNYVVTGNVAAKTLTVANGGKITVPANMVLTVDEAIINEAGAANFVVENDGILIQNTDTENTGAITVERNSNPMRRLEYTLWSSPVTGQNLQAFSPATLPNRIYELKETESVLGWTSVADPSATNFEPGKGYFFRSPNNYDPVNQQVFEGQFIGTPNNGDVNIMASYEFNGIGNPYPSPIDADEFILANDINALYFWTNNNAPVEGSYNTVNNWATYVVGSGTTAQGGGLMPDGIIQSGQGFIVGFVPGDQGNINFNNAMRVAENGQFFKPMSSEKHRIWLNLSNEEVVFNQILVGYIENATQGVDTGMDAKMFGYDGNALYSIIDNSNENYVIQARKLPFTASDVVALGFRAVNAGSFTISLNNVDGLFADNQNIYLKDNFTQAVHNLKDGAYTFVSEEGIFDTRFEVVYQTTMSTENPVANNANWVVYSQENGFQIQTQGFELKSVQVFDLLGRAIYTANAEGTAHSIPSLGADSVYIVKVTTTENIVLSKKVR